MSSNAGLFMQLLGAFSPEKQNPYYGAKEYTPEDQLKTLNQQPENTLDPYESVEEANKDGHNLTHSVWLNDKNEDVTKQVSDPRYNPRQPMVSPNFYQRFTNPGAAQDATSQNTAALNMAAHAQQVRDAQLGVEAGDVGAIRPVFGQPIDKTSNKQLAILTGGNNTSQNIGAVSESQAAQGLGVPAARALNTSLGTGVDNREMTTYANTHGPEDKGMARAYADYNTLTGTKQAAAVRLPVSQVNADASVANRVVATNEADAKNIEPRAQLEYEQLKATLGREPRAEELASTLLDTNLSNADIQQVVTTTLQRNKNTIANTARLGVNNEAFQASNPATSVTPFHRTPAGGVAVNSDYVNTLNQMNTKMTGGTTVGGTNAPSVGNGLNIVGVPDRPVARPINTGFREDAAADGYPTRQVTPVARPINFSLPQSNTQQPTNDLAPWNKQASDAMETRRQMTNASRIARGLPELSPVEFEQLMMTRH